MKIQLIRHATLLLVINQLRILIDPMLSPAGSIATVENAANNILNPLVDLPINGVELDELLKNVDAVILTHTHRDHFDEMASKLLSKSVPIFCQPEDKRKLQQMGFSAVYEVKDSYSWKGIYFTRTMCQHGTDQIGEKMAPASGFILEAPESPSVYICGDTIWCNEVESILGHHKPEIVIIFAGAAQFLTGGPITMTAEDIANLCRKAPSARMIAVHLEAFNHCLLTRKQLKEFLEKEQLLEQVRIPQDGEWMSFC